MKCANINSPEFKELLKDTNLPSFKLSSIIGVMSENQNDEYFPSISEVNDYIKSQNNVNYSLKAVEILSSDKAKQLLNVPNKEIEFLLHSEKLRINLNEITLEEEGDIDLNLKDKWNTFAIKAQGKKLGYIQVLSKDNNTVKIGLSALYEGDKEDKNTKKNEKNIIAKLIELITKLFKNKKLEISIEKKEPSSKKINNNAGKGVGKLSYELLAIKLKEKYKKELVSDTTRSDYAENLWKSFERRGKATVIGNSNSEYRWEYYYKFEVDTIEDVVITKSLIENPKNVESETIQLNLSEEGKKMETLKDEDYFDKVISPIISKMSKLFPQVKSKVVSESEFNSLPAEVQKS